VPLPFLAAEREQALELRRGLHALGGDRDAERAGERGNGAHDRRVGGLRIDGGQERAVDLELVDRQAAQVARLE
jgi:hypothetical protein